MKKLIIVPLIVLLFVSNDLKASYYNGGEITWECTSSGNFRFVMKLYRECYTSYGVAATYGQTQNLYTNVPGFSYFIMHRITGSPIDISPVCNSNTNFPHIYCGNPNLMPNFAPNIGAIQEHIYTSDYSYPNGVPLTGVPPANGWVFYWSSCCRIFSTNINNGPSLTYRLRAIMYPYSNQNVSTCFDNSPTFAEIPQTVFCTGYPTTFNYLVSDNELDSLVYSWGQPLISTGAPITYYATGYSWNSPFPGPSHNSNNVAATIHPNTGDISFTSYTTGTFLILTKVTAFKCGIKVAEIWREFQVALTSCGTNNPPNITPPFQNSVGQYTLYTDTVFAGDLVTFSVSGTDFEFLPNGSSQTVTLEAAGSQFGNVVNTSPPSMSATVGCLNPPCATLSPAPNPPNNPLTGQYGLQTTFSWQTGCNHCVTNIGCGVTSNVYNFVLKAFDDYCPVPTVSLATITIVVKDYPKLEAPEIHCIKVQPNGDVTLNWIIPIDTMNFFKKYYIEAATTENGPFVVIDSTNVYTQTSYTHSGANAHSQRMFYRTRTRSGCGVYATLSIPGEIFSTIKVSVLNPGPAFGIANIVWNPIIYPNVSSSTGIYKVFREYSGGLYNWTQIATTQDTFYIDTVTYCNTVLNYRIEIVDTLGFDSIGTPILCSSISSVDGDVFNDIHAPSIPIIDTVTVNPYTKKSVISWDINPAPDCHGYVVHRLNPASLWIPIDTVFGITNTTYEDTIADPCLNYQSYIVSSFDSCMNQSPYSLKHNTIKVFVVQDICNPNLLLLWNSYINFSTAIGGYNIYYSENNGPLNFLATVSASDTSYTHSGLNHGSEYCYFVQAFDFNEQKTSTSCEECEVFFTSINTIQNYNFELFQNIPNPTNKSTTINYFIPKSGKAIFKVVNIVGEIIYSKEYKSIQGKNKIELDISNFESGVYYYSLEFEGVLKVKKMIVLK